MKFCSHCAGPLVRKTPPGDDRLRWVCESCGRVHYENPQVVVGCIPEWQGRILLCRRAIEPRRGLWTLPAGYLENGETVQDGAARETMEEAGAAVADLKPYTLYNLAFVNQVYLMFRGRLTDGRFRPGPESLEAGLFQEADVPWDRIAFTVIVKTLQRYFQDRPGNVFPFHLGDIEPPEHSIAEAGR